MDINSSTLRMLWSVVDILPKHTILGLSDTALIAMLMQEVSRRIVLNGKESSNLGRYIGNHLHLIRDIATFPASRVLESAVS